MPLDLRELLARALPIGERFPDWRAPASDAVRERMQWPLDSLLFDVEHDGFWPAAWGSRPAGLEDALALATREFARAPRLVPLYGHRYLPVDPPESGNPVFSVYQTDVILYGSSLELYFATEFGTLPWKEAVAKPARHVPFWSELAIGTPDESIEQE
ncbi:MAG: SMI1/KNR4 family protein [Planctomycetota bacterium]